MNYGTEIAKDLIDELKAQGIVLNTGQTNRIYLATAAAYGEGIVNGEKIGKCKVAKELAERYIEEE